MIIYTDAVPFAVQKLGFKKDYEEIKINDLDGQVLLLVEKLFRKKIIYKLEIKEESFWNYLFIVGKSEESQFDILTNLSSENQDIPDRILCLASEGKNFHGFKNRPWATIQGNLHLSIYLKPDNVIEHFASAFMVLPAVSVVETIDQIPSLKNLAKFKWVNDILIKKAKVSGVISSTKIQGNVLKSVVLGIGLNIEAKPLVIPNKFVPEVTCLRFHTKNPDEADFCNIFTALIKRIEINYEKILEGNYLQLLDFYIKRSAIIGKKVTIFNEMTQTTIEGVAINIGEDLELYLKNLPHPIFDGRLIL